MPASTTNAPSSNGSKTTSTWSAATRLKSQPGANQLVQVRSCTNSSTLEAPKIRSSHEQ